jgi:serine/threonine protein kinase
MVCSFKDNCNLYVVMPYVPCGDLFNFLSREHALEEPTAVFLASQIALGIEYLHDNDILYR